MDSAPSNHVEATHFSLFPKFAYSFLSKLFLDFRTSLKHSKSKSRRPRLKLSSCVFSNGGGIPARAYVKLFEFGVRTPGGLLWGVWYAWGIDFRRFRTPSVSIFGRNRTEDHTIHTRAEDQRNAEAHQ